MAKGKPAVLPADQEAAFQALDEGQTLVRLENTTQMAIAVQRPRNEAEILTAALASLELYPEAAAEAVYRRPVGKDPKTGKQKIAEGLSIRAAEDLAQRWGNCAAGTEIAEITADYAVMAGVFLDYEKNVRLVIPRRVSRAYKKKGGGMATMSADRFDVAISAAGSKALREAILRSLPAGLKTAYMHKAESVQQKELEAPSALDAAIPKMCGAFEGFGVTIDMLVERLGHPVSEITKAEMVELRGTFNAISTFESTVEEHFTKATTSPPQKVEGAADAEKVLSEKPETGEQGTLSAG